MPSGDINVFAVEEPAKIVSPEDDKLTIEVYCTDSASGEQVAHEGIAYRFSCSDSTGGLGCASMRVEPETPYIATFDLIHTVEYTVTISAQAYANPTLWSDNDEWTFRSEAPLPPSMRHEV